MRRANGVALLAAVVFTAWVGVAAAGPKEKAKDQVQKGHVAYNLGHFEEAAACYERAYRWVQDPALLFNVAQSWRLANQPDKALAAYKGYLRTVDATAPNRRVAQEHIRDLERQRAQPPAPTTPVPTPTPEPAPTPPATNKAADDNTFRPLAPDSEPGDSEKEPSQTSWVRTVDPVVGSVFMLGTQRGVSGKTVLNYHFFGKATHNGTDYEVGYFNLPLFAVNPAFRWSAFYAKVTTKSRWLIEGGALGSHGEFFGGAGKDWNFVKMGVRLERIGDPSLCNASSGSASYVSPELLTTVPVTQTITVLAYGHLRQNLASNNCGFHPSMATLDLSGVWSTSDHLTLGGGLGFYRIMGQEDGTPAGSWPDLTSNAGQFHFDGRYDFGVFKAGASFRRIIYDEGVNQLTFDVELRPGRL